MAPFGINGPSGYSERDLGPDRIEVEYRGATVSVSPTAPRNDARTVAEQDKAHDLALWRAAQIAVQRGRAGLKIESEKRDSDVEIRHRTVYQRDPFYDPGWRYGDPFPGRFYGGPFGFYGPPYDVQDIATATAQADVKLTIVLSVSFDPKADGMLSAAETATRLQALRGNATY